MGLDYEICWIVALVVAVSLTGFFYPVCLVVF